jgi:hypothetical protein
MKLQKLGWIVGIASVSTPTILLEVINDKKYCLVLFAC